MRVKIVETGEAQAFVRGDVNSDAETDLFDAIAILLYLFIPGSSEPACLDAADANDNGEVDLFDAINILIYRYVPESPPLPSPCCDFPEDCGPDPTPDALTCVYHVCMSGAMAELPAVPEGEFVFGQPRTEGKRVTLPLYLNSSTHLSGFEYAIAYDRSLVRFATLSAEGLPTESFDFFAGREHAGNGELTVANIVSLDMSRDLPPGRYHVADVMFDLTTGVLERDLSFSLTDATLVDPQGNPLRPKLDQTLLTGYRPEPVVFALYQNRPNPFRHQTQIAYALPGSGRMTLSIHNASGELVRTLVSGKSSRGYYRAEWDGRDALGMKVPSGVYFYRIEAGDCTATKKMVFAR
jgi:hypothetical protein